VLASCAGLEHVGTGVFLRTGRKGCQQTTKVLKKHLSFSLTFIQLLIKPLAASRQQDLGALPDACARRAPTLLHPSSSLGRDAHAGRL